MTPTVLVTGAIGYQGSGIARQLLAAHIRVNALVRDPSKPAALELKQLGEKICVGGFDDTEASKEAAKGTSAVFLNLAPTLPNTESEVQYAKNVIQAAKEAGTVTSIVYSTIAMTGKHESFPEWGPEYPMYWYWTSQGSY